MRDRSEPWRSVKPSGVVIQHRNADPPKAIDTVSTARSSSELNTARRQRLACIWDNDEGNVPGDLIRGCSSTSRHERLQCPLDHAGQVAMHGVQIFKSRAAGRREPVTRVPQVIKAPPPLARRTPAQATKRGTPGWDVPGRLRRSRQAINPERARDDLRLHQSLGYAPAGG